MVYLPTFTINLSQMYIGKYTIHGSYGFRIATSQDPGPVTRFPSPQAVSPARSIDVSATLGEPPRTGSFHSQAQIPFWGFFVVGKTSFTEPWLLGMEQSPFPFKSISSMKKKSLQMWLSCDQVEMV